MAQIRRVPVSKTNKTNVGTGIYLARVISHLDPSFMGSLEVTLMREQGNKLGDNNQVYIVKYASPFFGSTAYEFLGKNTATKSGIPPSDNPNNKNKPAGTTAEAYNDTQKSYGMWFVPPDVGVTVLVVFVDGDPTQGYWIGCVPPRFANHMVPAIASSPNADVSSEDKKKFNSKLDLPVAEINKKINATEKSIDADKIKKPVHPIADVFLRQGLLEDDIRGITTTSSRREVPSSAFGISTPGPVDRRNNAKRAPIGKTQGPSPTPVPVSRLGGTQFVMDDGDDRYIRKQPASVLGQGSAYADVLKGEKGDPTIPYSEYFRIRTRTGHQLLMHNSEDLIYIGNAQGTTWIEMTSNGKIDIYAKDSVSVHTENDFNFYADRDVNIEAGRNINMKTNSGRLQAEVATDLNILVNSTGRITVGSDFNLLVGSDTKMSTKGNFNIAADGDNRFSAVGDTSIGSGGSHKETAGTIFMNDGDGNATPADLADFVRPLELHKNIVTSTTKNWADTKYQSGTLNSIMKRIPMHEPWVLHENFAPDKFTPSGTDREQQ